MMMIGTVPKLAEECSGRAFLLLLWRKDEEGPNYRRQYLSLPLTWDAGDMIFVNRARFPRCGFAILEKRFQLGSPCTGVNPSEALANLTYLIERERPSLVPQFDEVCNAIAFGEYQK